MSTNKTKLKVLALGLRIAAITFLHYADFGSNAAFHPFYRRLYYVPLILAAFHYGLKGGVAAATVVSFVYLPHVFTYWKSDLPGQMENLLEILIFFTVGTLSGLLVNREKILWQKTVRMERLAAFGEMAEMVTRDLQVSLAALRGLARSFLGNIDGEEGQHFSGDLFLEHVDKIETRFNEIEKLAGDRQLRIERCNLAEVIDRSITESRNDFTGRNSDESASVLWRMVPIHSFQTGSIQWRWKVKASLTHNKLERRKEGDDYAARIVVVFEPHLVSWKTRALHYVWAGKEPVGSIFKNPYANTVTNIVVESGNRNAGKWVNEERSFVADYEKIFNETPEMISAVAMIVDTDNTLSQATAWFDDINLQFWNPEIWIHKTELENHE